MPHDFATELIEGNPPGEDEAVIDFASDLINPKIGGTYRRLEPPGGGLPFDPESGEIDFETGPVTEYIPGAEPFADFATLLKTGFVDDPKTKMKIFAKARGIPLDRYGIIDGEIVFKDDQGNFQRETEDTFLGQLKRFASESAAHSPAIVMGTAGAATGNPALAALLAAGGEGLRKSIGATAFGEEQTSAGNVKDMVIEAIMAAAGEKLLGGGAVRGLNKTRMVRRGPLAKAAGKDLTLIDNAAVRANEQLGREFGVELFPAQTTGSKRLVDKHTLMQDLPASADIMQEATGRQVGQVEEAIGRTVDTMGPDISPMRTGEELVEAAGKAIKKPVDIRKAKAGPFYEKAFSSDAVVNTSKAVTEIDTLLSKTVKKDPSYGALTRIKSMIDEAGGDLEKLHRVKTRGIDAVLNKTKADKVLRREMTLVKDQLVKSMDKASQDYKTARKIFADYSIDIERQTKKTAIGELAKLEGDQVEKAVGKLLKPGQSSPERVFKAKARLYKENPAAWNAAIRQHLTDIFEGIKPTVRGERTNLAGRFHQAVMDKKQNAILKAAMDKKQYKTLIDFSSVLKMAASVNLKESGTASRQVLLKELDEEAGPIIIKQLVEGAKKWDVTKPGTIPVFRNLLDWVEKNWRKNFKENLAHALVSPEAAARLTKLRQLSPRDKKFVKGFTTLIALVTGGELKRKVESTQREDTK